jgi:hypothetical protein
MWLLSTLFFFGMLSVVTYFGLVPLKAAAEYRFRGKFSLTAEGLGFLGCGALALLYWLFAGGFIPFLLLGLGVAAGAGIRSMKGNDQRYIE